MPSGLPEPPRGGEVVSSQPVPSFQSVSSSQPVPLSQPAPSSAPRPVASPRSSALPPGSPRVGVVMGSKSDLDWGHQVGRTLQELGVSYELRILSAHRTPREAAEYAGTASSRGLAVLIAIAGLAAHLPGVLAAYTELPVIGLPLSAGPLHGQDALLSMVQMPPGVPVATVGLDNPRNAAILAAEILALVQPDVRQSVQWWRAQQAESVRQADQLLRPPVETGGEEAEP